MSFCAYDTDIVEYIYLLQYGMTEIFEEGFAAVNICQEKCAYINIQHEIVSVLHRPGDGFVRVLRYQHDDTFNE